MEIRYKSDLYASYLQIGIDSNVNRKHYIFQMLEENSIKGLLPISQRVEEGNPYLYLDVTAKRNLVQEYQEKEMQLEDLVALLQELVDIFNELRNYLLSDGFLLLEPEYIYRDMDSSALFLTLIPWERPNGRGLMPLAEFFLEKMSAKDEHGINLVYLLYRQQSDPGFSLYRFMPIAERESILKRQKKQEPIVLLPQPEPLREPFESLPEEGIPQEGKRRWRNWLRGLFFRKKKDSKVFEMQYDLPQQDWKEADYDQETVFFEEDRTRTWTLQWKERGRTKKADLKEFPLTIGKIRQEVSVVIEDASVSRVHCRFIEQDNGVGIMDMNSTNGTCLNGLRLKPGEIMGIEKNDEILVGKVKVLVV